MSCLISLFYIKPQLFVTSILYKGSCLISLFYIKPQQVSVGFMGIEVVLYRYSTSNHNAMVLPSSLTVLSYIVILHQTTTAMPFTELSVCCLISLFYIKPQLFFAWVFVDNRCLISLFYIKPQRLECSNSQARRCLISLFYIKPQPSLR